MANQLIGKNFTPPDLHGKVTGRARYAEDFRADGMLLFGIERVVFDNLLHRSIDIRQQGL